MLSFLDLMLIRIHRRRTFNPWVVGSIPTGPTPVLRLNKQIFQILLSATVAYGVTTFEPRLARKWCQSFTILFVTFKACAIDGK